MELRNELEIKEITEEKGEHISDIQRTKIYSLITYMSKDAINEMCPELFNIVENVERGVMKNELGRVIFHLLKNERLNTIIGLEKLLDASLTVNYEKTLEVLNDCGKEGKILVKKIKDILK